MTVLQVVSWGIKAFCSVNRVSVPLLGLVERLPTARTRQQRLGDRILEADHEEIPLDRNSGEEQG